MRWLGEEDAFLVVAHNQRRFIESARCEGFDSDKALLCLLEDEFGPNYVDRICDAIRVTGRASLLPELFSIQPAHRAMSKVWLWEPYGMRSMDVQVVTRKLGQKIDLNTNAADRLVRRVYQAETDPHLREVMAGVWTEVAREITANLYHASNRNLRGHLDLVPHEGDKISYNIVMGSQEFHEIRSSLTNLVSCTGVCGNDAIYRAGVIEGKHHVYVDRLFHHSGEALRFRRPTNPFDGAVVWTPYVVGGSLHTVRDYVPLMIRHQISIVEPGAVVLLS